MFKYIKILASILFFLILFIPKNATAQNSYQTGQHSYTSTLASRKYLLFLPRTYGQDPNKKWPMIVFLHGLGVAGTDVEKIRMEALTQMLEYTPNFPAIVLSPLVSGTGAESYWINDIPSQSVNTLITEIESKYLVNKNKIYLTGYSLGGGGTWSLGHRFYSRFAALVPVAGFYGTQANHAIPATICNLKNTPIWSFHGALDPTVPISNDQELVNSVRNCGGDVQFTVYPNLGHDISGLVYLNNQALYDWMFSKSLNSSTSSTSTDANNDGKVDGIDFTIWLKNYNKNLTGPSFGDFNNDNVVNQADYLTWLNSYLQR